MNRSGANPSETILNTSNVNENTFGKLFSLPVDGQIYAQPLYVAALTIPNQGVHNVVYICTENNTVYAYDADSATQTLPLWKANLGPAVQASSIGVTDNLLPEIGITGTPTIDLPSNTMYVVAQTTVNSQPVFQLHALDITTGADKFNGPVTIQGSVSGTGEASSGGVVTFNPAQQWQRPGLLFLNGSVYVAFGSHQDTPPYHGWIFSFTTNPLHQTGVLNTTPNGSEGGVWQGGVALAADTSAGFIYVLTGNGTMDANTGTKDYADSVLKLTPTLGITDYFSPSDQNALAGADADLGSAGAILMPSTNFGLAMGKEGTVFMFNRSNLGQYNAGGDQITQEWQATFSFLSTGDAGFFGGPVYYNSTLYVWGRRDTLKAFSFNGSTFNTVPQTGPVTLTDGYSNEAAMSISANGTTAGTDILWATYSTNGDSPNSGASPGILQALNASTLTELWDSNQNPGRDSSGSWAKWNPPTIANGKVYEATLDSLLNVYGLLSYNTSTAGSLVGSESSSAAAVNLTAEGTLDWVHWGDSSLNRKSGVTAQISTYKTAGNVNTYSNDPRPMNWTDGTPTATGSNNTDGVFVGGIGQGFSFSAPADTTTRTLVVHVGGWESGGTLTAQLSDGSAPEFTNTTATASGLYDANYTFTYHAASAGETLNVSWTVASGTGNVDLNAAALSATTSGSPASIAATAGASQSATVGTAFATPLQATVTNSSGGPVSGVTVTFTAPSSGAGAAFSGSSTANATTNASGIATAPTLTANGTTGSYNVTASVSGVSATASFSLTNTAAPPASIAATAGSGQSATVSTAFATALQATVTNSSGGPMSGVTVTFTAPSSGAGAIFGTSSTATAITSSSGVATAPTLTANSTAGSYSVTATVSGVSAAASFTLTNTSSSGGPSWYNSAWSSRKSITIAHAQVSGGSNLTNFPVLISIPSDANLEATAKSDGSDILFTASDGVTKYNHEVEFYSAANGEFIGWVQIPTLSATSDTVIYLYYGNPSASPQQNAAGVWDANYAGVWHMANDAASTAVTDSTSAANNGTAQRNTNVLNTAGEIDGALGFNGNSDFVNVVRNGHFGLSGQAFTLQTWVRDDTSAAALQSPFHRILSWYDGSKNIQLGIGADTTGANRVFYVVNSAGATGSTVPANQASTGNASTGFHHVVATFDGSSTYQLFVDGELSGAGNNVFTGAVTLYAGDPTNLYMGQRGNGTYLNGTLDEVRISSSARSPGWITTEFNNQSSPGTFITLGAPQANNNNAPASITATAGTGQSVTVGTAFATALQATVTNSSGGPVSGATVTFTAPSSGAGATFGTSSTVTATTNSSGVATASTLTANSTVGSYAVTAGVSGVSTAASFSLTNTAAPPASIAATTGNGQSATVSTAFATALQATVTNSSGGPVSGVTVTFTAPSSGPGAAFGTSITATASTNSSGVATASTLTANSTAGSYTVTASVSGVSTTASFSLTNTAKTGSGGSLTGSSTSAATAVNLTTEGTSDWVHWGDSSLNRKSGVTAQLSTYTIVGSGAVNTYSNDPRPINWTDGTPTATSSNNMNGIFISGVGQGFSFTAPADTTTRTLVVHVGGWDSGGTLTAQLSDGSAPEFTNTTATVSGQYDANYTITYHAATAGQTLRVTWAMVSGTGNVTLNAAAALGTGSLTGSSTSVATAVNLTTEGTLDWVHWGDSSLNRKTGVTAQLSTYTVVGSGNVSSYSNDPRPVSWSDGTPTAASSNNMNGVFINGVGQGFSVTAPAGTSAHTLVVHVGGWDSGGTLTAQLSDGSAAAFTDTTAVASGQFDRNYTVTYNAASAGQTLKVTWTMSSGSGNVTLNAAALE